MGSKERRAELEAELAALDDDDDDTDEVTISHQGQSFTGSWKRALSVAAAWGVKLVADPPADKEPDAKVKSTAEVKRFAGRRLG